MKTLAFDLTRELLDLVPVAAPPSARLLNVSQFLQARLEAAVEEERAVAALLVERGIVANVEPNGAMAVSCEHSHCTRELLHHYFICETCDLINQINQRKSRLSSNSNTHQPDQPAQVQTKL